MEMDTDMDLVQLLIPPENGRFSGFSSSFTETPRAARSEKLNVISHVEYFCYLNTTG
ncbi:hypothetical protein BDK88_1545 [Natrinema hispanicum]|uniref:Uncharacterized protein n=1 Tax=Natrinema hispanicum TaxID=392421 RepID=A0A482Y810_9EURY|nr:hypothetical protein BDK88_1545 [Natrinema hispanicum]